MRVFRSGVLALLLGLTLCTCQAFAAGGHPKGPSAGNRKAERGLSHTVGRLWEGLVSLWGEAGCQIDPLGRCSPTEQQQGLTAGDQRPAPADAGCQMDPLGCSAS
jgi:hypothetical protein